MSGGVEAGEQLPPPVGPLISAAELRRRMAEIEAAKAEEAAAKRAKLEAEKLAQIHHFMDGRITAQELVDLRRRVAHAVANGHTEVEVVRFPSSLLADKGRAINSGHADWPSTLTGEAKTFYRLYRERAAPLGYGLEARILDYPEGLLGDVGLFLTWGE